MPPRDDKNNNTTPRSESSTSTINDGNLSPLATSELTVVSSVRLGTQSTVLVRPHPNEPAFVQCESPQPYATPPSAKLVNQTLNLNLGQSWLLAPERNKLLLWIIKFLNNLLVSWWEGAAMQAWDQLPISWRRALCLTLWKWYLPLHKRILGRSTGIHRDASLEYHAMTTVMYWGRFFPVSVQRMRFSLSQLNIWCQEPLQAAHVETIRDQETALQGLGDPLLVIPQCQRNHTTVKGKFIYRNGPDQPTEWTLMWIYGGAFLSGDVDGNLTKADLISRKINMDVFLAEYRLVPEYDADDISFDMTLAYRWLCQRRQNPRKILLLGISSGASVCTRMLQYMAEKQRGQPLIPSYLGPLVDASAMPAGAILMGPFVDFTQPQGALVEYPKHDLIVNQRVLETGLPYLDTHVPDRTAYSPVHRSFEGLPPLCVVVSEHEAVYDMSVTLVNRARADGVDCTLAVWKYMCHVFSFLDAFIPEGRQSVEFVCEWIRHRKQQQQQGRRQG